MPITLRRLRQMKTEGEKITMLTAYDATFAQMLSTAGVEILLVGDSVGMVVAGHDSTIPVTVEQLAYHTRCVHQGNQGALLMTDMPFMSFATVEQALTNAAILMQAGAAIVKIEGGAWLAPIVHALSERGIPVCAHLGLTCQSVHMHSGYRVQGREENDANAICNDAIALSEAGAQVLLLECVPNALTTRIMSAASVPVIGIGAGPDTDGQVLVTHDMLGITPGKPKKFTHNFMEGASSIPEAISNYVTAVKQEQFPTLEDSFT